MSELAITHPRGWLRDPLWDLTLIAGVAALALGTGFLAAAKPELFPLLLFLDLWLLGYHHVASTFTRLAFDRESIRRNRFLIFALPPIVLGAVVGAVYLVGGWIVATTYLYWQWFHYTRQSYGIERAYRRRTTGEVPGHQRTTRWLLYAVATWGILARSHQAPERFLGMELKTLPVPALVVDAVGLVAAGLAAWWLLTWLRALASGTPLQAHGLYLVSHVAIFAIGYVVIQEIDHGWLTLNVWHNAQYILFVWHFNSSRFRHGVDPKARLLSTLSQRRNWPWYFATCLGISTLLYTGLDQTLAILQPESTLPLVLIAYQTINFHHYVVDGLIWKMRKKPLQRDLGLVEPA